METSKNKLINTFHRGIRLMGSGFTIIAVAALALALAVGANSAAFKLHNLISIHPLTIEDHNYATEWRMDIRGLEERRNSFVRDILFHGSSRIDIRNR